MIVVPSNKLHFQSFTQQFYLLYKNSKANDVSLKELFFLSVCLKDQGNRFKLHVCKLRTVLGVLYYLPIDGTVSQRHSWLFSCTVLTLYHCILILVSCEQGHSQHANSWPADDMIADGKSSFCCSSSNFKTDQLFPF